MRFEMSLLSCDDEIGLGRFFRFSQPRARARARHRTRRLGRESSRRRFSLSTRATLLFSSRVVISMRKARRAFHPLGSVFSSSFSKFFERSLLSWMANNTTTKTTTTTTTTNKERRKKYFASQSTTSVAFNHPTHDTFSSSI